MSTEAQMTHNGQPIKARYSGWFGGSRIVTAYPQGMPDSDQLFIEDAEGNRFKRNLAVENSINEDEDPEFIRWAFVQI